MYKHKLTGRSLFYTLLVLVVFQYPNWLLIKESEHISANKSITSYDQVVKDKVNNIAGIDSNTNNKSTLIHTIKYEEIGLPILVVGMPKVGTTSITEFFKCSGRYKVSHHQCRGRGGHGRCGVLIRNNVLEGRPPLQGTGDFDVSTPKWMHLRYLENILITVATCLKWGT